MLALVGCFKQNLRDIIPSFTQADFFPGMNHGAKLLGLHRLATGDARSLVFYITNIQLFAEYLRCLLLLRKRLFGYNRSLSFPLRISIGRNWPVHGCVGLQQ
jgi:hypothetical protein